MESWIDHSQNQRDRQPSWRTQDWCWEWRLFCLALSSTNTATTILHTHTHTHRNRGEKNNKNQSHRKIVSCLRNTMPELSFFDQPRFVSNDWRIFLKRVFNIWSSSSLRQSKQHISRFYLPTWSKDKKEKSICLIPCKPLSPLQIGKVTKRTRLRSQDCFYSFLSVTLIEKNRKWDCYVNLGTTSATYSIIHNNVTK